MSENTKPQDPKPQENAPVEDATTVAPTVEAHKASRRAAARATAAPTNKIKVGEAAEGDEDEPMRAAARMPQLPSDEEIALALKESVNEPVHVEPTPTGKITMRPPESEVAKRQAAMERAANTKPVLTRVVQVLLAICFPIVLLVLAIRLVTTSAFLWIEYHRPGFPADSFGFTTEDRMTYGSYTVDYLLNLAQPRYLGDLVDSVGKPLFKAGEVSHMADVKTVIDLAFMGGLILAVLMLIGMLYLARRSFGGIRRGLFAGSIVTLVIILAVGVFAATGWERFFTDFHEVFFSDGTWTFFTDDTLIRLFPSQFWLDAGIFIGAFVFLVASLTMAFTWPTRDRRRALSAAKHPGRRAA